MVATFDHDLGLLGVTTMWGNHDVRHTTDNSLRVLSLDAPRYVAVHPGCNGPVRPRLEKLPSGRADVPPTLPIPPLPAVARGPAVEWLVDTLRAATRPVVVVPTGP